MAVCLSRPRLVEKSDRDHRSHRPRPEVNVVTPGFRGLSELPVILSLHAVWFASLPHFMGVSGIAAARSVCRLRGGQGRAVVDENDRVRGAVTDSHQYVDTTAASRVPETETGRSAVIANVGQDVDSIFLAVERVELDNFDNSMQVQRNEVIWVIRRV